MKEKLRLLGLQISIVLVWVCLIFWIGIIFWPWIKTLLNKILE